VIRLKTRLPAVLISVLLLLSGCGLESGSDNGKLPGTSVRVRSNGSLDDDPPPLTLRDIAKYPDRSPQAVVLRLWFFAQWGSTGQLAANYATAARRRVGSSRISDGFAAQRNRLLQRRPQVLYTLRTDLGSVVALRAFQRGRPPRREWFVLRKHAGRWVVVFDTVLEEGLRISGTASSRAAASRFRDGYPRAVASAEATFHRGDAP
jgi:hypothetical protein